MKYKCGDKVLVRMKIERAEVIYQSPSYRVSAENPDLNNVNVWVYENEIYSLAPEFNPGEKIEVRDSDKGDWLYKTYLGVNPFNHIFPFAVSKDGVSDSYKYARKIQPKEEVKPDKLITIDGQKYKLTKVEE